LISWIADTLLWSLSYFKKECSSQNSSHETNCTFGRKIWSLEIRVNCLVVLLGMEVIPLLLRVMSA
jgi:hypothetical protein